MAKMKGGWNVVYAWEGVFYVGMKDGKKMMKNVRMKVLWWLMEEERTLIKAKFHDRKFHFVTNSYLIMQSLMILMVLTKKTLLKQINKFWNLIDIKKQNKNQVKTFSQK